MKRSPGNPWADRPGGKLSKRAPRADRAARAPVGKAEERGAGGSPVREGQWAADRQTCQYPGVLGGT